MCNEICYINKNVSIDIQYLCFSDHNYESKHVNVFCSVLNQSIKFHLHVKEVILSCGLCSRLSGSPPGVLLVQDSADYRDGSMDNTNYQDISFDHRDITCASHPVRVAIIA